ncbi:3-ketoacyl-ACP reductase [Capsulimonas corticalis]|uniref:3-ketoacyl-ACP reductase n=1 Tax=Capsulimonas corticalis TaxID=2219043 RepID=A0A402CTE1_9BACT|nr:3-oxoacyl-ACP reductase family protein [Capsulimonas corticalis]BDI30757.1 3-ketoacyl-ACP reductase [Capsulimonas corticalis]
MATVLAGKVALVTGGSRGIGAAIAKRLAADGAAVALTYSASPDRAQEVVEEIVAAGGRALAILADSADAEAVRSAVAQTVKTFDRLDILVNNAGILSLGSLDEISLEYFDRAMAINVRAVFVASQAASPYLSEGGRIITIGSVVGDRAGFPGAGVYSATKAAVAGLTKGIARDLGPRGITVNNIQPGPTETDMNPADGPHVDMLKGLIALGRMGKDTEIASLAAYLASPEAAFITGASLTIDGGFLA